MQWRHRLLLGAAVVLLGVAVVVGTTVYPFSYSYLEGGVLAAAVVLYAVVQVSDDSLW